MPHRSDLNPVLWKLLILMLATLLIISGVFFLFVFLTTLCKHKKNKVLLKPFCRFTKHCQISFTFQNIADFVYLINWWFHLESLKFSFHLKSFTFQKFIAFILNILYFKLNPLHAIDVFRRQRFRFFNYHSVSAYAAWVTNVVYRRHVNVHLTTANIFASYHSCISG